MTAPADGRSVIRSVLEEERDFLLRSLRDLESEHAAGDIDDLDYHALRDDYTVRAAAAARQLSDIDSRPAAASPISVEPSPAAPGAPAGSDPSVHAPAACRPEVAVPAAAGAVRVASPWRRRVFIGLAALIVIGGVTGTVIGLSGSTDSSATRVQKLDVAAQDAIGNGTYAEAVKDYEAALKIEPTDVVTLTGEGELLVEVGAANNQATLNLGLTRLQSAEIADPSYGPAFGARGIGLYDKGDYAGAVREFETYLADTSSAKRSTVIENLLATAKRRLAAQGS